MPLPKEQIDAMRECLQILSPLHTPTMRQKMALNTESFIQKGKWFEAFELEHIPILFYPTDRAKANAMSDAMESAYQNGELLGLKQHKRRFLPSHLAAWPDCPPVPAKSPLRFWLPASMQVKPALSPNVSIQHGLKTIVLPSGTTHVPFNEVAHLIAYAIHPDINDEDDNPSSYHFALIGLETELKRAAKFGQLPVKNKLTLGAHELPIGNALNHVLVTVDDLRAFVADRGIKVAVEATEPQATEVKAKPRISRAPVPITPLTWSNHKQAIATVTPSPKWDKWRHMRDIEIWEAVALSLNLEPDELPVYLGAFDKLGDDPFRICPPPFLERLLVVNSNCGISFSFKLVHDLKARCLVDLPEFAAWVVKQNMANIPPEIVAMGAMQQHEKSEKARKQTKELNAMRIPGAGGMPIQSISEAPNVAKPKQRVQEIRILELLILKKYDPLKLPFRVPGKGGAKAEIRKLALSEPAIFTAKTFATAWQRLRDDGSIGDAK